MEDLLKKYIHYVRLCDGVDFITQGVTPYGEAEEAGLTREEWQTLERLAEETRHA